MKVVDTCAEEVTKLRLQDIPAGAVFECWGNGYRGTYIKTTDNGGTWLEQGIYYSDASFLDSYRYVLLPNAQLVKGKK